MHTLSRSKQSECNYWSRKRNYHLSADSKLCCFCVCDREAALRGALCSASVRSVAPPRAGEMCVSSESLSKKTNRIGVHDDCLWLESPRLSDENIQSLTLLSPADAIFRKRTWNFQKMLTNGAAIGRIVTESDPNRLASGSESVRIFRDPVRIGPNRFRCYICSV